MVESHTTLPPSTRRHQASRRHFLPTIRRSHVRASRGHNGRSTRVHDRGGGPSLTLLTTGGAPSRGERKIPERGREKRGGGGGKEPKDRLYEAFSGGRREGPCEEFSRRGGHPPGPGDGPPSVPKHNSVHRHKITSDAKQRVRDLTVTFTYRSMNSEKLQTQDRLGCKPDSPDLVPMQTR